MKVINQILKFLNITFAIFTFVTLFMVTYNLLTTNVDHLVMATKMKVGVLYWQIMFFASVTALSVVVIDLFKKLNPVIARILKFFASYAAFYVWFFVLTEQAKAGLVTFNVVIMGSGIFLIVYTAIIALKLFAKWLLIKLFGEEDDSYVSVFGSIKK